MFSGKGMQKQLETIIENMNTGR